MRNIDLHKVLNELTKAQYSNVPFEGCARVWAELNLVGPWAGLSVLIRHIQGTRSFLRDFCNPKTPSHWGGEGGLDDRTGDIMCILVWYMQRGFFPSSATNDAFNEMAKLVGGLGEAGEVTLESLKAFCARMKKLLNQFPVDRPWWGREFDINPMTITPRPTTCPEVVNEDWIRDHLNQYNEIQGVVLEMVVAILLAFTAAIAAALAAAALLGSAALATAIASATAALQSALAWLLGEQAAVVAAGLVGAISATCIADDTDIGVEEEEKGSGCCLDGEVIDDVPGGENGCLDIGGTWGDLAQLGCLVVPEDEK